MTDLSSLEQEARRRHQLHELHPTHRPLSSEYEFVGLSGEAELARRLGGSVDMTSRPGGDGGTDNTILLQVSGGVRSFKVDVKTARKPYNLLVEAGKVIVDTIYVLAGYSDKKRKARLLGWEWGRELLLTEPKDFGKGVLNHSIHITELRDIEEIESRIVRAN